MKKSIKIALAIVCCLPLNALAQKAEKSISIEVENAWNKAKENEPVVLKIKDSKCRIHSKVCYCLGWKQRNTFSAG